MAPRQEAKYGEGGVKAIGRGRKTRGRAGGWFDALSLGPINQPQTIDACPKKSRITTIQFIQFYVGVLCYKHCKQILVMTYSLPFTAGAGPFFFIALAKSASAFLSHTINSATPGWFDVSPA
jgi:hypothetical protein